MANKKPLPLEDPPTASSSEDETSEEEEVSSSEEDEPQAPSAAVKVAVPVKPTVDTAEKQEETSEEEEGSSSEEDEDDEPQTAPVKTPPAAVNVAAAEKQEVSESETGSESETDSDSETERPNPPNSAVTVVSPKPKQKEATLALPAVKSGTKRASEGISRDTKKRAKTVASGDDDKKTADEIKKSPFARIWSEDDEITVLQGMIDFEADTGKSPYEDTNVYYEFIRKSISFDVSKIQFTDKIFRLKNKYMGKDMKGAKTSFTKPHDQKCLTLAKTIWGPEGIAVDSVVKSKAVSKKKSTTKKKKLDTVRQELVFNGKNIEEHDKNVVGGGGDLESDWFENSFLVGSISGYGIDENYVKQKWRLVQEETKKKFEDRFNALQAMEIDFVLEKTDLLHEMTSMIAEAFKKSSN